MTMRFAVFGAAAVLAILTGVARRCRARRPGPAAEFERHRRRRPLMTIAIRIGATGPIRATTRRGLTIGRIIRRRAITRRRPTMRPRPITRRRATTRRRAGLLLPVPQLRARCHRDLLLCLDDTLGCIACASDDLHIVDEVLWIYPCIAASTAGGASVFSCDATQSTISTNRREADTLFGQPVDEAPAAAGSPGVANDSLPASSREAGPSGERCGRDRRAGRPEVSECRTAVEHHGNDATILLRARIADSFEPQADRPAGPAPASTGRGFHRRRHHADRLQIAIESASTLALCK